MSVSPDQTVIWFLLPNLISICISGYYVITVGKQWNKNIANLDVTLNVSLIVLWIIYGSSKAYICANDTTVTKGFSLLTVIYGWINAIFYLITSIIYGVYFF
ncbi:hypothetical protein C1645_775334 [Glomus cerebriforme]|uniref:Uncharacterized protein n=1 Tax=Glomus cerebriforme TaxID=658196 RepID=A0A397SQ74_9GLOM|nr:hypothetical protein C1645_775334 [Glomus cerebriforme]